MDSISDSRLNTSNDSLGTTTGDSVPTHSNTIHADTPRPSVYDNTSMSDKSVDEEALQDDLLATQMQATASYLSGNISPQQKAAAIAAFHAMLSVAEGESEAKPLDLTESPPKSLMSTSSPRVGAKWLSMRRSGSQRQTPQEPSGSFSWCTILLSTTSNRSIYFARIRKI